MATQDDFYALLGVPTDATGAEIKHAFLELAKQYHPDRHHGTTALGTRFQQINRAYGILGNPEHRAKYDAERASTRKPSWHGHDLDPSIVPPGFDATAGAAAPHPYWTTPRESQPPPPAPPAASGGTTDVAKGQGKDARVDRRLSRMTLIIGVVDVALLAAVVVVLALLLHW